MKNHFILLAIICLFFSCQNSSTYNITSSGTTVKNSIELNEAIKNATAGTEIILANGVWKDVEIKFIGKGTENKPIKLRAETLGKVSIEGKSDLKFAGEYLIVEGLYFKNGYSPSNAVITFRVNENSLANHCQVTNCIIEDFNPPQRDKKDHWVEFWGRHNKLDHCYIAGKSNQGPTIRVDIKGNESINNYHQIVNNHFGPRPRKGGPRAETIQIGDSYTSMSPCYTNVSNNLFEKCNGEVEVISSKTNFNQFRNNVFYKCEGSLVTRHGNYCTIDGNYFIGDENNNIGGVRIINTGHWVTNNYFYNLKGSAFRSPLAVMNGIPKSPLNRYNQVTDVVVAYNTWVNCKSPLQFGVGTNISQKDVLPKSEIRSARPIRTTVANNIIYNVKGDVKPLVAHDKIDGIKFKCNIINNQNVDFEKVEGIESTAFEIKKVGEEIFVPSKNFSEVETYQGFDFERIGKDIFGNNRTGNNSVGAMLSTGIKDPKILDYKKYGPSWFSSEKEKIAPQTFLATNQSGDLAKKISEAKAGDIIELASGNYELSRSLMINKRITIRSKDKNNNAQIIYSGEGGSPAFEMNPRGELTLENIILKGKNTQIAFATLKKNMSSLYNLTVSNCEVSQFNYILKAYKETMSDDIIFTNCLLKNCNNGIELSEETNDKGDYNVEFLTIENCEFDDVRANVIDYYRGGYDESTIGGNLLVTNNTFTNCGNQEKNRILLNTRGIINVNISKNTFKNNRVKLVALLWGAKNNSHSDNTIINSGEIRVEENLKLKLMY